MAAATVSGRVMRSYRAMKEIVIEQGWRERLEGLAGRRKEMWPLLMLAGAAVVVTILLTGRSAPARVAPPSQTMPSQTPPTASASAPPGGAGVLVHVAGEVRKPGLYEFPPGARVADAVETAGGPTRRGDLHALNLAEALVDGTRIEVLRFGDAPAPPAVASAGAENSVGAPIPLNTADQVLLETIPGVGPVTAMAILAYREEIGSFTSLEQLLEVDGIGPATFDSIRTYVTL